VRPLFPICFLKKNLFKPFFFRTSRTITGKWPLKLFFITALVLVSGSFAHPEIEYAPRAPLAQRSLLLDVCVAGVRMVTVGERGHILLSDDNGTSWRQANVPTVATLTGVFFENRRLGWAVGHDAVILKTLDGGENWTRVHYAPEQECPLLDVFFLDEKTGFAIGAYGLFLETMDGGDTWSARSISQDDWHLNHMAESAGGRLYIAAESGTIYRSDDKGKSWISLPSPYQGSFFGTLPLTNDALLLFGLRGNLFRSEDAGDSWSRITTNTKATLTEAKKLADGTIIVVGLGATFLVSRDGGHTFLVSQQAHRKGFSAVLQDTDNSVITVGENGIKKINLR
jgi:photosystem II stability/assembly factor-like uncharacterized protein